MNFLLLRDPVSRTPVLSIYFRKSIILFMHCSSYRSIVYYFFKQYQGSPPKILALSGKATVHVHVDKASLCLCDVMDNRAGGRALPRLTRKK